MSSTNETFRKTGSNEMAIDIDRISLGNLPADLLAAAARGEIDLNLLARAELANRGAGTDGKWVGFSAAAEIHGTQIHEDEDWDDDEREWTIIRDCRA